MIVTVASQKGGVGKTTLAVHIAAGLAASGLQVLVVDLDPQGHCSIALGVEPAPGGVFGWLIQERPLSRLVVCTGRERLRLLPSDKTTATAATFLEIQHSGRVPRDLLSGALAPAVRNGLDVAVLDTSPTVGALQALAMAAAGVVVVPAACDMLSQHGLAATVQTLEVVESSAGVVVVPTMFDARTKHSQRMLAELRGWSENVLPPVHQATIVRDALAEGKTVLEHAPASRAARDLGFVVEMVRGAL